ncbi:MAG: hypothetical protein H0X29_11680 [Parachlamydiaceae bacterium]|nr:hypothetical protein [Parachlamydiaceae bacterium]
MKFAVAKEHRDFFNKYFRIEFNKLFSAEQCHQLMAERLVILSERLKVSKANFKTTSVNSNFMAGFDLWRGNGALKKIILQKSLAEIAADLLEVRALRIGYDQLIPSLPKIAIFEPNDAYNNWLSQTSTLHERSSIQGLMAGLIICIKAPVAEVEQEHASDPATAEIIIKPLIEAPSFFSTTLGNGVYFSPETPLDFSDLASRRGYTYLLIAYSKGTSVYCKKDSDVHTNAFRPLGYNFGDRLNDRFHPLIIF